MLLTLFVSAGAASLAAAAPAIHERRQDGVLTSTVEAISSDFPSGSAASEVITTATTLASVAFPSSSGAAISSADGCAPVTVTMTWNPSASAAVSATTWASGAPEPVVTSVVGAGDWSSANGSVYSSADGIYTIQTDTVVAEASSSASSAWASGSAAVPTTTTFAKRQVPSSFAGVDDGAVSSSIAAVDNGVSSSFADDGTVYTSYAGDDEGCIFSSYYDEASDGSVYTSTVDATNGVVTSIATATATGCAPTFTVWVNATTATGFSTSLLSAATGSVSRNSSSSNNTSVGFLAQQAKESSKSTSGASSMAASVGAVALAGAAFVLA